MSKKKEPQFCIATPPDKCPTEPFLLAIIEFQFALFLCSSYHPPEVTDILGNSHKWIVHVNFMLQATNAAVLHFTKHFNKGWEIDDTTANFQ